MADKIYCEVCHSREAKVLLKQIFMCNSCKQQDLSSAKVEQVFFEPMTLKRVDPEQSFYGAKNTKTMTCKRCGSKMHSWSSTCGSRRMR